MSDILKDLSGVSGLRITHQREAIQEEVQGMESREEDQDSRSRSNDWDTDKEGDTG